MRICVVNLFITYISFQTFCIKLLHFQMQESSHNIQFSENTFQHSQLKTIMMIVFLNISMMNQQIRLLISIKIITSNDWNSFKFIIYALNAYTVTCNRSMVCQVTQWVKLLIAMASDNNVVHFVPTSIGGVWLQTTAFIRLNPK